VLASGMQRVTVLEESAVSDQWNGGSVRLITLLSAAMALGMGACTSEETLTEPSASASHARASAGAYTAVDLGTLGSTGSFATDINPAGQVVGGSETAAGEAHAFLWEKGIMTDLGPGAAYAINPAGQVVGASESAGGNTHAFLWDKGVMTDLGAIDGFSSVAEEINPAGQVVGTSGGAAVLWNKGLLTDMGMGPFSFSHPYAINPAGQVVGTGIGTERRAFLWSKGVVTDLGTLGSNSAFGTTYSEAADINPTGQIVGWSQPPGETFGAHAFLWEKGVMTDLGTLGGLESASEALAINPAGQVVGVSTTAADPRGEWHIFFWEKGIMTDLGTLGGPSGRISAINPAGQFVGWRQTGAGVTRATLWTRR
jgi:probable HAF family extracellular repeat protein